MFNFFSNAFQKSDSTIGELREKYPDGLHLVVGDTHGECATLKALMSIIEFDSQKDHVYFVGDYNGGGNPYSLLHYMEKYFQADFNAPGFHMIRGNHERELGPMYELENLPDIIVVKRKEMSYYIAHAGMIQKVFDLIANDIESAPENSVFAYKLADDTVRYDAPFRQVIWSMRGLYSQRSRYHIWPSEDDLHRNKACIVHGHTPYGFLLNRGAGYGDKNCLLKPQNIWFSEDLQSFNIDSNVKGRDDGGSYNGLSCLCLEVLEEISCLNNGCLTVDGVQNMQRFFFSQKLVSFDFNKSYGNIDGIARAAINMKTIGISDDGSAYFL